MSEIIFRHDGQADPASLHVEMVERKGLGHPDTLADAIAEEVSRRYAAHCIGRFGAIAHHWFDKVMLLGGETEIAFGLARILRPVRAMLAGKAVLRVGGEEIPLAEIFEEATDSVLAATLKNYRFAEYCVCEMRVSDSVGPGQRSIRYRPKEARELGEFEAGRLVSNDCNLCVGFAPYTTTESLALDLERFLLSPEQQRKRPWLGTDIKTILTRIGDRTRVLANVPLLATHVGDLAAYSDMRQQLEEELGRFCGDYVGSACDVVVNPEWIYGRAYLTATGTCLDTGDIGVVGRGNRPSGLITPMRSMSIEASAGKNPLDHTGKLLNAAAGVIADRIHRELGVANTVYIFAQKGDRVEAPSMVAIQCHANSRTPTDCEPRATRIAADVLGDIDAVRQSLLSGTMRLY